MARLFANGGGRAPPCDRTKVRFSAVHVEKPTFDRFLSRAREANTSADGVQSAVPAGIPADRKRVPLVARLGETLGRQKAIDLLRAVSTDRVLEYRTTECLFAKTFQAAEPAARRRSDRAIDLSEFLSRVNG